MRLKNYISILYIGVLSSFFSFDLVRFLRCVFILLVLQMSSTLGFLFCSVFLVLVIYFYQLFVYLFLPLDLLFKKNTGYLNSFQNNSLNMPRNIIVLSYPLKLFTTYNFINFIGDRCKSYLQFPTVFYILRGQNVKKYSHASTLCIWEGSECKKKNIFTFDVISSNGDPNVNIIRTIGIRT